MIFTGARPAKVAVADGAGAAGARSALAGSSVKQLAAVSTQVRSTRDPLQLRPPSCPGVFTVIRVSQGRAGSPVSGAGWYRPTEISTRVCSRVCGSVDSPTGVHSFFGTLTSCFLPSGAVRVMSAAWSALPLTEKTAGISSAR